MSTTIPTRNEETPGRARTNAAGVAGNVLEWYDFAVFGYLAPYIGAAFFPSDNETATLLETFGVFAFGYLMRPLGGVCFGHLGDRLGRRTALLASVTLMLVPTFLIGLIPDFQSIGLAAPALLIFLRMLQGLSVGGELMASVAYMAETAPAKSRGFYGSLALSTAVLGLLLGSGAGAGLELFLTPDEIQAWGWRLPFLGGIAIGGAALWMRRSIPESPAFETADEKAESEQSPLREVLSAQFGRLVHLASLVMMLGAGFYLLFVWLPTYLNTFVSPPVENALVLNTIAMTVLVLLIPAAGALSDRVGRRPVLIVASAGTITAAIPLFFVLSRGIPVEILAVQLTFAVLMGLAQGPIPAAMVEMFPTHIRASALGLGYNTTVAVFGGTAPLVATWLISETGSAVAPALYLMVIAGIALAAALLFKDRSGIDLNHPSLK